MDANFTGDLYQEERSKGKEDDEYIILCCARTFLVLIGRDQETYSEIGSAQ
jgi:hypothetical protein